MRTTLDLPDELLRHLKVRAASEGRSLRDLTLELIERGMQAPLAAPVASELPTIRTRRPIPKRYCSNAALSALAFEE